MAEAAAFWPERLAAAQAILNLLRRISAEQGPGRPRKETSMSSFICALVLLTPGNAEIPSGFPELPELEEYRALLPLEEEPVETTTADLVAAGMQLADAVDPTELTPERVREMMEERGR